MPNKFRDVRHYGAFSFSRFKIIEFSDKSNNSLATVELISDDISVNLEKKILSSNILNELREISKGYIDIICRPEYHSQKREMIEN